MAKKQQRVKLICPEVPEHLAPYVVSQDPAQYTAIDHASWRYIMRVSRAFFAKHAHKKYLDGLEETGIATDRIPLISEINAKLNRFGWRAVGVLGFIPPAIFLELQSLGILPIACDMRQLDHLAYTPAPDIVHEAAGHAPIIADKPYRDYLLSYGEVARKAIISSKDMDLYEAIRHLSETKEDPRSSPQDIEESQQRFEAAKAAVDYISEAAYLARMTWWTTEYGLVGDTQSALIYGAGLLSSVGESYACVGPEVAKIPLTLDCLNMGYDITRPQPQLYVTPSFKHLGHLLEEFASTMAFRRGGIEALAKAKIAATVTTTQFENGLQISGVLQDFHTDSRGEAAYLSFSGPSQLALRDRELPDHGPVHHKQGYGTPVGFLKGTRKSAAQLTERDLRKAGFKDGQKGKLHFASGVVLEGVLRKSVRRGGKYILLTFHDCTVKLGDRFLFRPEWGVYDMACGASVASVFGGAADRTAYWKGIGSPTQRAAHPKSNRDGSDPQLIALYERVRAIRESGRASQRSGELAEVAQMLDARFPKDWLLRLEILELDNSHKLNGQWTPALRQAMQKRLQELASSSRDLQMLVRRGLQLL